MLLRWSVGAQVWFSEQRGRLFEERGATAVEYALMLALIAAVIVGAVAYLGTRTTEWIRDGHVPPVKDGRGERVHGRVPSPWARLPGPWGRNACSRCRRSTPRSIGCMPGGERSSPGEVVAGARAAADEAEIAYGELKLQLDELDRDQTPLRIRARLPDPEGSRRTEAHVRRQHREREGARRRSSTRSKRSRKRRSDREDELLALMEQRDAVAAAAAEAESRSTERRSRGRPGVHGGRRGAPAGHR